MILVDYSQMYHAIIHRAFDAKTGEIRRDSFSVEDGEDEVSPRLLRHVLLNSILFHKREFSGEFGELLFCVGAKVYWRRKVYPNYKWRRGQKKEVSPLDWEMINDLKDRFKTEIRDVLRLPLMEVPGAEADDLIGVMTKKFSNEGHKVLILSSDNDFLQLQHHPNVSQYSMSMNKYVSHPRPRMYLKEHIITGDPGDDIPNILSDLNTFRNGIRQTPLCRKKKLPRWLKTRVDEIEDWTPQIEKRFNQNRKLIDLDLIPKRVQEKILVEYDAMNERLNRKIGFRESADFSSYFMENGLSSLFSRMSEF